MKSRIITGLVASAFALVVLLLLPWYCLHIAMAGICALAMYEILVVTKFVRHRGMLAAAIVFALAAPFLLITGNAMHAVIALVAYVVVLAFIQILYHDTLPVEQTGFVFLVSLLVPISFSCLAYMRVLTPRGEAGDGLFYVFLAIVMPWMCDMGAYFVGTFLGRHKLCPGISPKKTVEGLIGGVVVSVGSSVLAAWLYQLYLNANGGGAVSLWQIALIALVLAPLSVMGDLFASIIKRQCEVKDFGHIMPGHGGIMDRFDSLMFVAPVFYIVIHYLPLVY